MDGVGASLFTFLAFLAVAYADVGKDRGREAPHSVPLPPTFSLGIDNEGGGQKTPL